MEWVEECGEVFVVTQSSQTHTPVTHSSSRSPTWTDSEMHLRRLASSQSRHGSTDELLVLGRRTPTKLQPRPSGGRGSQVSYRPAGNGRLNK